MHLSQKPIKGQVRKTLRFSFIEGAFASAMTGFTQEYFTPFLLVLNSTAKHVAMLSAFPNLFASLIQLKSADFAEKVKSRKRIVILFVLLQALMILPMVILAIRRGTSPYVFIIMVILFTSFGAIANPAWASLMSDLVPTRKRGEYFGWRNKTLGFIAVGMTFIAGCILSVSKKINIFSGFALIFFFAFIFRVISWYYLRRMYEPKLEIKKEHYFNIVDFLLNIRTSNFAKFTVFVAMMNFSVNIAAPFFSMFILRDLKYSYLLYTIITVTATLTIYFMIGRWGRHADKVGNLKVIKFVAPLIGIIPLLWIINRTPLFLIFAQIFSGLLWAGFNLCSINFIYDAVMPQKRTRCIAYFNVINGLALCCGALLGGFLLKWLPQLFGYKILTLFLISSCLRLIVGIYMPRGLREVRPVENVRNYNLFFSIIGIRPLAEIERKAAGY